MIDLMVEHIRSTPNLSNKTMCKFVQGYATDYAITENLLQKTHSEGKDAVFGNPYLNVKYYRVLKAEMEREGNCFKLLFANQNNTTKALSQCVVEEANCTPKKDKLPILIRAQQTVFLNNWSTDYLSQQLVLGEQESA